jgi:hypothetical protein
VLVCVCVCVCVCEREKEREREEEKMAFKPNDWATDHKGNSKMTSKWFQFYKGRVISFEVSKKKICFTV